MADEPPDYIDWHADHRGPPSFFGCIGAALGLVFLLTGGTCVYMGFSMGEFGVALIGLGIAVGGWMLIRR